MKSEAHSHPSQAEAFAKLCELIKDIHIAMLTTASGGGTLRSRPMATLQVDSDTGTLWFFTADDSPKVSEIQEEQDVGLSYASPGKQSYVSVSGRARLVHDKAKIKQLWTPVAKLWFPQGVDDPRLALLSVQVQSAEYWDAGSSKMLELYGLAKFALTGQPPKHFGENEKVTRPR